MSKCDWDELAESLARPFVTMDAPEILREDSLLDRATLADDRLADRLIARGIRLRGPGVG